MTPTEKAIEAFQQRIKENNDKKKRFTDDGIEYFKSIGIELKKKDVFLEFEGYEFKLEFALKNFFLTPIYDPFGRQDAIFDLADMGKYLLMIKNHEKYREERRQMPWYRRWFTP